MTTPICQNLHFKVMECFQVNPLEILNCSALVNEFTACVDRTRVVSGARMFLFFCILVVQLHDHCVFPFITVIKSLYLSRIYAIIPPFSESGTSLHAKVIRY